jgi:purine-nucleoside phosphorylase
MSPARKPQATASDYARAQRAAKYILSKSRPRPKIAVVLGSGLGAFAHELAGATRIPYEKIPGFARPTAKGHAGQFVLGKVQEVPVAVLQGRVHFYEGCSIQEVVFPMRVLGLLGIQAAVLTNASGAVNLRFEPGELILMHDHIGLFSVNPLIGLNEERFGTRFPDMSEPYDKSFRQIAVAEGNKLGMNLKEGVYAALTGPSFETPAEIRFLRTAGADMVGMSTVPEVIVARHMDIRVLGISCVTNMAAGILDQPLTHAEVMETGERVTTQFIALLRGVIPRIAKELTRK